MLLFGPDIALDNPTFFATSHSSTAKSPSALREGAADPER
jgi:hypothetical protein